MGYRRNGHIEPKLQWAINTQKNQIANRLTKVDNKNFSPDGIDVAGSNISAHAQPFGIYHTARAIKDTYKMQKILVLLNVLTTK